MTEWILILTMHLSGPAGEIRDISPEIISGFSTQQKCEAAASEISSQLIILTGKAREHQAIQKNTSKNSPAIWNQCIPITK